MDKYLNEDAITAEIMSYVKNRIYNYAVLIDGDWGTGKTYFIQKSIIPTLEGSGYILSTYTNMFHLRPLFKFLVYLIFLCLIDCISLDILS